MNNQFPFGFVPEDNFSILNDIKNLYSQINSIQQQLNSLERRIDNMENKNITLPPKLSPVPLNNNFNYPTDNYII